MQFTKMEGFGFLVFCIAITSIYSVHGFEMNEDKIQVSEFDVKPGGMTQSEKKDWEEAKFSCNFTYQAQGGTQETWLMGMSVNSDHTQFSCSAERPGSTSYLMFQSVKMQLLGARVVEVEVKGSDNSLLKPEEFAIDENANFVSNVEGKFQGSMGSITVYGVRPREEL